MIRQLHANTPSRRWWASLVVLSSFCGVAQGQNSGNPPAPGFNLAGSDARAIAIADEVMEKMGGRQNWDNTHYLKWRFFGRRLHVWDKWTGDIRVEHQDQVILMNLNTHKGRAWKAGVEVTHADSLAPLLQFGYEAWINDSYWVFMPYKLKDSGVTLKYVGEGQMADSSAAEILELTFAGVGVTPENKYLVYVDKKTRLVGQWDYFEKASDEKPRISSPWTNWQRHGKILLSDGRGRGKHTEIAVFDQLPVPVFKDPAPVDWSTIPMAK
ncbi:MAG: hypothetical protein ACREOO_05470 [bacterium]